ncbi:extracellular solute-binding protein [Arcanobacterium phocisimile]|uniref:Extracellular solute-binding protein n=1 Tax=Arcanobacterium phocisimile TaxID=1302235 RepID=A0ABX7IFJ7_9ACTO|nr:extracellular solute-binding protein [Arcanobacterium phocisimile]QRV01916.1 extracellular solute-binding protein [Arcanobacterium phocisimile]
MGGKLALSIPFGSDYLAWYFQNINWSFGGSYSKEWDQNLTSAQTIEAGQWLQEMVGSGLIETAKTPSESFAACQSALLLQSTGSLQGLEETVQGFELATAFLPGFGDSYVCPTGRAGIAIPAKVTGERRAAAVKFIAFMTNDDSTSAFSQATGYMPVTKGAQDNEQMKSYMAKHPHASTAVEQLAHTRRKIITGF